MNEVEKVNPVEKASLIKSLAKTGLTIAAIITAYTVYHKIFGRTERPDYKINPGLFDYDKVKDELPRTEMTFKSKKETLNAYYYECKKPIGLVVLVHGFKSGSDAYLPITMYLVKNGFNVFTYDGTGVYESTGKYTVGFSQGLVDLDYALQFVKSRRDMSRYPLFLLGHSCGGFAVNAVLNLHKDVKACASIAAVNDCYKLLLDMGYRYGGEMTNQGLPKEFLDEYQRMLFGKYCDLTSLMGVNSVKIPVLIAHGNSDETISFDNLSLISHRAEITNPNVKYYYGTNYQGGHDSIWHSEKSILYKKEVDKKIKSFKRDYDAKVEYCKTVDHQLYSEINYDLLDDIIALYKDSVKKKWPSLFRK